MSVFSCSCGWASPDSAKADSLLVRLAVHVALEEAVRHWEAGHRVSCPPEVYPVVERAALSLAARRRGVA